MKRENTEHMGAEQPMQDKVMREFEDKQACYNYIGGALGHKIVDYISPTELSAAYQDLPSGKNNIIRMALVAIRTQIYKQIKALLPHEDTQGAKIKDLKTERARIEELIKIRPPLPKL